MFYPDREWTRKTPESMGIPSGAIARALKAIAESKKDIHSMLIVRDGALVFEHYFAPYVAETRHALYSCSKTFTSMLIGIAQEKGLLRIEDKLYEYYPEIIIADGNELARDMRIKDLLMMGTGHGDDTFGAMFDAPDKNYPRAFFSLAVDHEPGTHFIYNNGATYMLSNLLTRLTGRSALDLANEWIFSKIGIEGAIWQDDGQGVSIGASGLYITPTDMARFGWLIMNEGRWKSEQVLPAAYVREAQLKHIDNRNPSDPNQNPNWAAGYGYQMWRCAFDAFRADGMGGQYICMMPQKGVEFVFTSGLGDDMGYLLDVVRDYLMDEVRDAALNDDEKSRAGLLDLSKRLSDPPKTSRPKEADGLPWGKEIVFSESQNGIERMRIDDQQFSCTLNGETICAKYAWNAPELSEPVKQGEIRPVFPYDEYQLAGRAYWENGLTTVIQLLSEPMTVRCHFTIDGDDVTVDWKVTMGISETLHGKVVG